MLTIGCGEDSSGEANEGGAEASQGPGGKADWYGPNQQYLDTHDHYAHAEQRVDRSRFDYFHRKNGQKAIALTLDCAWVNTQNGEDLLNALDRHGIKATFFISGPFIFADYKRGLSGGLKSASLPMIQRMIDAGHDFGNHTTTHPHLAVGPNYDWEMNELRRGWEAAVRHIYGGYAPANAEMKPFWRAPYGEYDEASLTEVAKRGYPYHFGWNIDIKDTTGKDDCNAPGSSSSCWSASDLTQEILDFAALNDYSLDAFVVLGHLSNPYMWGAHSDGFDRLVYTMSANGYVFAKLDEILDTGGEIPADDRDASCRHNNGGLFIDGGCTSSYQCCGGAWVQGHGQCGQCACLEPSGGYGSVGCFSGGGSVVEDDIEDRSERYEAQPAVGAGACGHNNGGVYQSGGCSNSYQCCDGVWRLGQGACGACVCLDAWGQEGC
ncbi:polysaccharide deacetylase family protein [Myxococcota bacterium]|nr:polysaccharide deacetylase family protein [Myxococcota bacterium]